MEPSPRLLLPSPAKSYLYPSGPTSSAPFGSFAPIAVYFFVIVRIRQPPEEILSPRPDLQHP